VSANRMIRINPENEIPVEIIDTHLNWCFSIHNIGKELWMARDHDILIMNTADHSKDSITPLGEDYEYYNNLSLDNRGDLWSFDTKNLYWINSLTKNHKILPLPDQMPESICNTGRMLFKGDSDIWITSHTGCALYSSVNKELTFINHDPDKPYSIGSDFIINSYLDKNDIVWLATHQNGVSYYDYNKKPFFHLSRIPYKENSLISDVVYAMDTDQEDRLWIGTEDGLDSYDTQTRTFNHHRLPKDNNRIDFLICDDDGSLYLTSRNDEFLSFYNPETGSHSQYEFPGSGMARSMYINPFNEIFIGRVSSSSPLLYFDIKSKDFTILEVNVPNKKISNIYHVFEDSNGILWLGIDDGCLTYNRKMQEFSFIPLKIANQDTTISGSFIHYIFEDSKKRIWLASAHGLFCLNSAEKMEFSHYNSRNGLPTDVIKNIREDLNGNLWMGTDKGICKFDPKKQQSKIYAIGDGINGHNFEHFAICSFGNGNLAFGGNNGLTLFNPAEISDNPVAPEITLTRLKISNNEVGIGELFNGRIILKKSIETTQKISLTHLERNISIEYAAMQYSYPTQNTYAYMLEGFEESWNYVDKKREAVYTNLPFGTYIFKVKAANKDGLWNETPVSLNIEISPPWWKSSLAYIAYVLLLAAILFAILKVVLYQKRLKDTIKIEKLEKEKENELNQMKLMFFTDISHEFKTPLTLIIGPLDQIIKEVSLNPKIQQKLVQIQQNSKRLLRLINQLIDFRKIEQDVFRLNKSSFDIIAFTRNIVNSFKDLAQSANISMYFRHSYEKCFVFLDQCQYENVLYNLLSNAIKYNKQDGQVIVSIEKASTSEKISLIVEDSGIGIPDEKKKLIFERFCHDNNRPLFEYQKSSGLGLYLIKNIVELHKGEIEIESTPDKGTKFTILWPAPDKQQISKTLSEIEKISSRENTDQRFFPQIPDKNSPTILIVEDNKELREYIRSLLWHQYRIEEAENGKMALEIAFQESPDLIITDVMMPVMDGIALCKALRINIITSHIPIIILSAKNDLNTKLKGFELGIDGYVEKPFEPELMLARITSILNKRKMLKEFFSHPLSDTKNIDDLSVIDKNFLERLDRVIEDHISDTEFGVDKLREELEVTKVQLYKKLDVLTGLTPRDYIRQKRLSKASLLIKNEELNFSEIAYSVGFSAPSNFNRAFKSFFGVSPSEYRKRNS
jgi:signal transduction histidine kinase/DNA-binding response OmpR family regulator/streptogramin lyase